MLTYLHDDFVSGHLFKVLEEAIENRDEVFERLGEQLQAEMWLARAVLDLQLNRFAKTERIDIAIQKAESEE